VPATTSPVAPVGTIVFVPAPSIKPRWVYSFIPAGLSVILAGWVGFQALYIPNATWGSVSDVAAALFWGLGISTATLAGYAAVANEITKVSS
jgi:hypothetical protein